MALYPSLEDMKVDHMGRVINFITFDFDELKSTPFCTVSAMKKNLGLTGSF